MPVEVGELERILRILNQRTGAVASAVVTRTGVPLASALPDGSHAENFGTMAATMLGALEVIYTGLARPSPAEIVVMSASGVVLAHSLTPKAFLVTLSESVTPELRKAVASFADEARAHLGAEP